MRSRDFLSRDVSGAFVRASSRVWRFGREPRHLTEGGMWVSSNAKARVSDLQINME